LKVEYPFAGNAVPAFVETSARRGIPQLCRNGEPLRSLMRSRESPNTAMGFRIVKR